MDYFEKLKNGPLSSKILTVLSIICLGLWIFSSINLYRLEIFIGSVLGKMTASFIQIAPFLLAIHVGCIIIKRHFIKNN